MREDNINALKEIIVDEIRMSLRESTNEKFKIENILKNMEVSADSVKTEILSSFKDIITNIDDEVESVVSSIIFDLDIIGEDDNEYWGG